MAAGTDLDSYLVHLNAGGAWGYIVRLPAAPLAPCLALGHLLGRAPWLTPSVRDTNAMIPLIQTRRHAIVKPWRTATSVRVDWNGTFVVMPTP